jgi:hypothetical protein
MAESDATMPTANYLQTMILYNNDAIYESY